MTNKVAVSSLFRKVPVRRVPLYGKSPIAVENVFLGVEVEVEDPATKEGRYITYAQDTLRQAGWSFKADGSLKEGSIEFVFTEPLFGLAAYKALSALADSLRFNPTARASMHVHVDWSGVDDAYSLCTLAALLYCLEPAVFAIAGEGRKHNNYCRPIESVGVKALLPLFLEGPTALAKKYLDGAVERGNADRRYFGANFVSLSSFGTVEFRYFPSPASLEEMVMFVNLCLGLREAALGLSVHREEVLNILSTREGIEKTIHSFFTDTHVAKTLLDNLDIEQAEERMRVLYILCKQEVLPASPRGERICSKAFRRWIDTAPAPPHVAQRIRDLDALRTGNVPEMVGAVRRIAGQ